MQSEINTANDKIGNIIGYMAQLQTKMILDLIYNRNRRIARQLIRDTSVIIEHAEQMFTDNRLSEIADAISTHIERASNIFGEQAVDLKRAHYEYRKLHKEARRSNQQADLTTFTLVIIILRSKIAGAEASAARTAIDQFIVRYGKGRKIVKSQSKNSLDRTTG